MKITQIGDPNLSQTEAASATMKETVTQGFMSKVEVVTSII